VTGAGGARPAFPDRTDTPAAWRLAAAVAVPSALGVGVLAARTVSAAGLLLMAAAAAAAYVLPVARASRRPPLPPDEPSPGEPLPLISVVVAGRDEAAVLPHLVADLAAQDHRDERHEPRFELIVVDDRSVDGTEAAVLASAAEHGIPAITRVIRRQDPAPDGKGAALTAAQPDLCRGDVVIVLDADARIAPEFLRRAAGYFARGAPAMTARRRVMRHSALAQVQDDEQTADGELQRGRWALGGCSEFRGNGIMVRRDLLAGVGGWHGGALCEDIDLSSRLAAAYGVRVGWAIDAVVWEEPVETVDGLWRQRTRWAEGVVRRQLALTLPLLRSPRLSVPAKLDYLLYSAQTLVPLSLLGAYVGGALFGDWRPAVGFSAAYLATGTVLATDSLRWTTDAHGRPLGMAERIWRGLRATLFSAHWVAVFPVGWARVAVSSGPVRYVKMEHSGAPADWSPEGRG
jgi:1,2-diacylglycerol 3-beta-glucosyltransferase